MTYWAVINTHPQSEGRALAHLERQGYSAYAPRERLIEVKRGRKVEVERFLFPRYLFVWIEAQWYSLLSTFGVSRLLMEGEVPGKVKAGFVEGLIAAEVDGAIILPKPHFKVGDRVRIEGGLFDGQCGLYQGQTSRQREVVLLERLGRVELASGCLR